MAEANESSNAHLDQSPSPDQFVSREQFDALTKEHEKLKTECERLSAENALLVQNAESVRSHTERDLGATTVDSNLVNLESANALLKTQHEGLIEAFERKDFLLAESEEKIYDLKRKVQRMEEQLQQETERNVENELKLQENEETSAELDRKCNGLFRQVEFINVQLQQSEERMSLLHLEIADLHNQLEDSETEIHTMTMSAARNLSKATDEIKVLRQQNAVDAEDLAKERSDRELIEADKDRLAAVNEECMASREQAERNLCRATERIGVLTDQNAELAEELAEERSDRDGIEADRDRLAVLNEECMASREQTERNLSTATEDIRVLTDQNAELAEELAEERSDREGIEAEIDRLENVDNENMALRRQIGVERRTRERGQVIRNLANIIARRALQIMHPVALHDVDEIPNNLG